MSTVDDVGTTGPIGELRGDAPAPARWDDARALFTEMALATTTPAL